MREPQDNPADGPMQERRKAGVVEPERPRPPSGDTPDQRGIEIDHEDERPPERR